MKTCFGVMVIIFCLIWSHQAFAERVSHHGAPADANGSAEDCISCHDGSLAHTVSFCTVQCDFSTSHSLFKRYPPLGKIGEYAPVAAVQAQGIKIVNGMITCISCHNLRNPEPNHLIMSNKKGALCLSCHIRMAR